MKYSAFLVVILSLVIFSCDKNVQTDEVFIRVMNVSDFDYKNVVIYSTSFGDINAGDRTDYMVFDMAYSYSFVSLEIGGETFVLQPIDYVGEVPLENGKYSFLIDISSIESRSLIQTLVKDE